MTPIEREELLRVSQELDALIDHETLHDGHAGDGECHCGVPAVPCTVLDPFGGSGTTAGVALYHRRNAILCELNPEYAAMVPGRIDDVILRMRKREAKRAAKKQPKPLAGQKTLFEGGAQ